MPLMSNFFYFVVNVTKGNESQARVKAKELSLQSLANIFYTHYVSWGNPKMEEDPPKGGGG